MREKLESNQVKVCNGCSGSEALQLFSGYCRCHIASNIVEYKYHRKFSEQLNDATQDSEETATAFTVSQTSHNLRKKL